MHLTMLDRRPHRVLLVVLLTALTGVGAVATSARAADRPALVDVRPLPGAVATPADAELRALVAGDTPTSTSVEVDGTAVPHTTTAVDGGTQVRASLSGLAPGEHVLHVAVSSDAGSDDRSWSITTTDHTRRRLAGPDRFATATTISRDTWGDGEATAAVVVRADEFPDALAGGPLAVHLGGPLLLTDPTTLPTTTADELDRVLAPGARVHVLGGRTAVSDDVVDAIEDHGHRVVRHAGQDRYATAAAVAALLPPSATAVLASGLRFPDALAASVPAAREGWPILLTDPDTLPDATATALDGLDRVLVVGGEVAVSADVQDQVEAVVDDVQRIAGADRFATAVALADRFLPDATEVAVASGRDHPDALAAGPRAAALGAPLLLTEPGTLPDATGTALRDRRPDALVVHGGPRAVSDDVADAVLHAVVDGPEGPRVLAQDPASGEGSETIAPITIDLDRPVTAESLVAATTLDDTELPTDVRVDDAGTRVVVDPLSPGDLPLDEPRTVHVVLRAATDEGATVHHTLTFVLREDDHVFSRVGSLELVEPSAAVEMVGYHQSNHEGAQQQEPDPDGPPWVTMSGRGRNTGSRTSADVVADPDVEVVAPVTGTVVRAGTYVLYCDTTDDFVAIEPDGMPGIEVKLLHFRGLRVGSGDRVVAGETVIGDGPRQLPFESQVDEYSSSGHGPHVHVEVVDTSIPNVPNGGSGSEDC